MSFLYHVRQVSFKPMVKFWNIRFVRTDPFEMQPQQGIDFLLQFDGM